MNSELGNFKKYQICIKTDEDFDRTDENFKAIENFLDQLVNEMLDDQATVLVVRIPDCYSIADIDEDIEDAINLLRQQFAAKSPNTYVVGLQFDVECTNKPDKVVCWPDILDILFVDEDVDLEDEDALKQYQARVDKAINDMAAKLNAPKIIIPGIIT